MGWRCWPSRSSGAKPSPARCARAAIAFLIGIILFSGSLYLLALAGWRGFALITPLGGTALLIGWALLLWHGIAGRHRA